MEFIPLVIIAATIKKIVDVARHWIDGDHRDAIIVMCAWSAGIALALALGATPWAYGMSLDGYNLATVGVTGQILVGIALGSTAGLAHDAVKPAAPRKTGHS